MDPLLFESHRRRLTILQAIFSLMVVPGFPVVAQPQAGDIAFEKDFEGAEALRGWQGAQSPGVRLTTGFQGGQALVVESPATTPGSRMVNIPLAVESLRGARLLCQAMIKAEDVTQPPQPWNGIKFMLHLRGPGGQQWLQQDNVFGLFDWKRVQFKARVPRDTESAELILGLEAVSGRAHFDDLKIVIAQAPRPRVAERPAGPPFTGHDEPRLRGAMIHPEITPESLRLLGGEWRANLIRWQLIRSGPAARLATAEAYAAWLEGELKRLDAALPLCTELGVRVVLDLHSPWGGTPTSSGYVGSDTGLFTNRAAQAKFVEGWQLMARRYRESKAIWGYDLANEPVENEVGEGCEDWQALATRAARAIREIDPIHAIIVEPTPWGGPEAIENLEPIPVPGVVYSVHMYVPHAFTHQGVHSASSGLAYPGTIDGKSWDKEALRRVLQPVVEWQRDYGVHIYLGEFSAIRWAPDDSAFRYLRDGIELFEEFGWDWSYHAFREWDGWSVEHGPDRNDRARSATPTSREKLLRDWYGRNPGK